MRPAKGLRQHQHTDTLKNILRRGDRLSAPTLRNKNNIKMQRTIKNRKITIINGNKREIRSLHWREETIQQAATPHIEK